MEGTKEQQTTGGGLVDKILPPRLEDAGLEDCALPSDSIIEAFLIAATAVKSRATSIFTGDDEEEAGDCVQDPWPEAEDVADEVIGVSAPEMADKLVGVESVTKGEEPGPCVTEKGGGVVEEGGDKVVVVGGGDVEEGNLGIEEKVGENNNGDDMDDVEERGGERPILTEGFV